MSTALKQMTVDEFLVWAEGKEGRWELHDGVPVMMTPERSVTLATKGRGVRRAEMALSRRLAACEVFATARRSRSTSGRSTSPTRRSSAALKLAR